MSNATRIAEVAKGMRELYELADEFGLVDELRAWWKARPRVIARRARRAARRRRK